MTLCVKANYITVKKKKKNHLNGKSKKTVSSHYLVTRCREPNTRRNEAAGICRLLCKNTCACVCGKSAKSRLRARARVSKCGHLRSSPRRRRRRLSPLLRRESGSLEPTGGVPAHLINPLTQDHFLCPDNHELVTCICPKPSVGPIHSPACAHFPLPAANRPGPTLASLQERDFHTVVPEILPLMQLF